MDARGAVTENRYDAGGRRTNVLVYLTAFDPATTAPSGPAQSTTYVYDANGNQTAVTDSAGNTTVSVYDPANRVTEVDEPATGGGVVSRFTAYDGLGRKLQESDEAGVASAYTYDFRGLLTSVTLAFGTSQAVTTVYAYDEWGNLISQTDAANHTTTFAYDALGRRVSRTLPAGQTETMGYDVSGNLLQQTNFNGVVITNGYDGMNRLTNRWSTNGYQVTSAYNPTNGLRTNMTDPSGTTAYGYDGLGRLTNRVVSWTNGPVLALNYGYMPNGSLTNLWSSTSGGVTNYYQYDLLGRLTNVLANGGAAAGYGYDGVGNLQVVHLGNGVTNLYQYDSRNRLTNLLWKLNATALGSFAYQLGPTGNRTNLSETVTTTTRTYSWAYDYLYRLTGETISGIGGVNYAYDAVGNRTNRTSAISQLATSNSSYNVNDLLTSDGYDPNGNTTNSTGNAYQYDVLNHLTNVNNGSIVISYDGDGNRLSKKVGSTNTYYLVDDRNPSGYAQVVEEWTAVGGTTNLALVYNYGMGLINQRAPGASTNYFVGDGHGSTRLLVDTGGNVVNAFAYDAYGTLIASNATAQTTYLYCAEQFDADLGFYYLRARYLNPASGRFWTMDTFEGIPFEPRTLHKYLYCGANPVNHTDPGGHDESGTLAGTLTVGGGMAILDGIALPAINAARLASLVRIGAIAIAITATLSGDDATNGVSVMRSNCKKAQTSTIGLRR